MAAGRQSALVHLGQIRHSFEREKTDADGREQAERCLLYTSRLKSTVEITPEVLRQVADTCNIIKAGPRELSRDEIYEILMECL